jgi:cell division transport system ATP-binding protein
MPEEPIIEFQNCSIFQKEHLVLSEVNFSVHKSEFIYLIGKVGSGKSSLIKTINGQIPLTHGEARVGKFDLKKLKRKQIPYLRRTLGVVFQDFQLLNDRNIEENLAFVLHATGWSNKKMIEKRIADVLEKVGLKAEGFKMPHQLSGGEQQRIAIARALLNDPEIILADEPTGNLDPDTSAEIMKILTEISSNSTCVVMATHNYTILKKFPAKTFRCEEGKLKELLEADEIDVSSL